MEVRHNSTPEEQRHTNFFISDSLTPIIKTQPWCFMKKKFFGIRQAHLISNYSVTRYIQNLLDGRSKQNEKYTISFRYWNAV